MNSPQLTNAKKTSIIAVTAALYAVFFYISSVASISGFTILYLPAVLLGVLPLWFGFDGLIGSMIGAFIGGAIFEGFGLLGVFEIITAIIIYMINWLLQPKQLAGKTSPKKPFQSLIAYGVSLFAGTSYILWQYSVLPKLWDTEGAIALLLPEFGINFLIMIILCPTLNRVISPKLKNWGIYSGNFWEWLKNRSQKTKQTIKTAPNLQTS